MAVRFAQEAGGGNGAGAPAVGAGTGPGPRSRTAPQASADEHSPAQRRLLEAVGLVSQPEAAGTVAAHAGAMQTPTTSPEPLRPEQAVGDGKRGDGGQPKRAKMESEPDALAALRPVDLNQSLGQGLGLSGRRRRASISSTEGVHALAGAAGACGAGGPVLLSETQGTVDSGARQARRRSASASPRAPHEACPAGHGASPQPDNGMGQAERALPVAAPGGGREPEAVEVVVVSDGETHAASPAASPAARPRQQLTASTSAATVATGEPQSTPLSVRCSGSAPSSPSPGYGALAPAGAPGGRASPTACSAGSDPSAACAGTPTSDARACGRGESPSPCPDPTSYLGRHVHHPTGHGASADGMEPQRATATEGRLTGKKIAEPRAPAGNARTGNAGNGSGAAPAAEPGAGWMRRGKRGGPAVGERGPPAVGDALALLGMAPALACSAAPRAPRPPAIVDRAAAPAAAARAAGTLQGQQRGGAAGGWTYGPPAAAAAHDPGSSTGLRVGKGSANPGLQSERARVFRPPTCRAEAEAAYAFRASVTVPRTGPPAAPAQARGAPERAAGQKADTRPRPGSPGACLVYGAARGRALGGLPV